MRFDKFFVQQAFNSLYRRCLRDIFPWTLHAF